MKQIIVTTKNREDIVLQVKALMPLSDWKALLQALDTSGYNSIYYEFKDALKAAIRNHESTTMEQVQRTDIEKVCYQYAKDQTE